MKSVFYYSDRNTQNTKEETKKKNALLKKIIEKV